LRWRVEFYEEKGNCPVRDFLDGLGKAQQAKVIAAIRMLEEEGPNLPFPYSSQVRGKVRELRIRFGRDRLRVLYFGDPERTFVLLHALSKRTDRLLDSDIAIAEARVDRHLKRLPKRRGQP